MAFSDALHVLYIYYQIAGFMSMLYNNDMNSKTTSASVNAKKMTMTALLAALALIFSYIEVLIPFNPGIPGIKLGIANLVIIISLYYLGPKYAFSVNLVRILIAGLLFNGLFGALYSLAGALLSFTVMVLLRKSGIFSITGVSIAGGVSHNMGQLLVAAFLIDSLKIFAYFPVLIFSGIISGAVIGIISYLILKRLPAVN